MFARIQRRARRSAFRRCRQIEQDKAETAENFGWQWTHFTQEDEKYAEQFLGWLQPVKPEFFAGKIVLEGGCGKGRHTTLAAHWGAKEVVGIDLSAAVETAFPSDARFAERAHRAGGYLQTSVQTSLRLRFFGRRSASHARPEKSFCFARVKSKKRRLGFGLDLRGGK